VVELKFAEGWTQEITAGNERNDLLNYCSDTHKALYGYRPRLTMDMTLEQLRAEALQLQSDVEERIEENRRANAQRAADESAHHLAYAQAMKPKKPANRPFTGLRDKLDAFWAF